MERRAFLRTGLAAGALGWSGAAVAAPRDLLAQPRPLPPPDYIKLSSNENPLGISPAARQAIIDGLGDANRYPQGREALLEALAERHRLNTENIALGAGSTEVLKMAVDALIGAGGTLIVADPTYEDATGYAEAAGIRVLTVPITADGRHDLPRMRDVARSVSGPALVYVCNPNNPTGTLTPSADVDAWIENERDDVHFLVDEAYYEYVDHAQYHSALRWIPDRSNVLVARTFSKVYGMAGIRLGYIVAHADTTRRIRARHVRNNANHFAIVAGLASLDDPAFVRRSIVTNAASKRILYDVLQDLDLEYYATHTNFVMHRIPTDVETHRGRMMEQNIRVGRPFPPMLEWNRVSLGLPDEMERFAEVLRGFRNKGWV